MKDAPGRLYRVLPAQINQTLSAAMRTWLADASWGAVRNLLKTRRVLVNGNLCLDAGRRLKLTDVIKVLEHPAAPLAREDDVLIRYLDQHLVVVEKPSGMTSVRHAEEQHWTGKRRQQNPTLEDVLPRLMAKKEAGAKAARRREPRGGPPPARTQPVRPVHRLDRDTSGLMVFARTVVAERHLGEQFRQHTTHRRYLALARGEVQAQTIATQLVRDRGDGRRGSTTEADIGKHAVTHVRPLEKLEGATLIECQLETGRTHQIRIHLAERGHPLLGETIYHQPRFGEPTADTSGAPRLALHAAELGFKHPVTGEAMYFEMPLPDDLEQFLRRLRHAASRGQ